MSYIFSAIFLMQSVLHIPVQAYWSTDHKPQSHISLKLSNTQLRMTGSTNGSVVLTVSGGSLSVSPFISPGRGLSFNVTSITGKVAYPKEPLAIPPSLGPVPIERLENTKPGKNLSINFSQNTNQIFPGPGRYKLSAKISLMNVSGDKTELMSLSSNEVVVDVIE